MRLFSRPCGFTVRPGALNCARRSFVSSVAVCVAHVRDSREGHAREAIVPDVRFEAKRNVSTCSRATLLFVSETQNITLSLPRDLLKRIKRVAADRDTSVSAIMADALARVADEDRRYDAARLRALAALKAARSLGTEGRRTWTRDELHGR
jgi:predicted transcriptional regulator